MKVNLYPHKTRPGWYTIDYRPNGAKGRRERVHYESYELAAGVKAELEGATSTNKLLHPRLRDICQEYLAWCNRNWKPSTCDKKRQRLEGHIIPALGQYRVHDLSQRLLDTYTAPLPKVVALNDLRTLKAMIAWMVTRKYAKAMDWAPEMPKYRPKLKRLPDEAGDALRVIECLRKESHRMVCLLMLLAGIRWCEARLLRWENYHGGRILLEDTKTDDPQTISIPAPCLEWFEAHRKPSGYVFSVGRKDTPPSHIQRRLQEASERAGVKMSLHMFRHMSATVLYDMEEDIYAVQHHLRHTKVSTTEIYTRYSAVRRKRAVDRITDVFFVVQPPNGDSDDKSST